MVYRFGDDPRRDARWLTFLDPAICPVAVQRQLLRSGYGPDELLASPPAGMDVIAYSELCAALERAPGAPMPNGIAADQPVYLLPISHSCYPRLLSHCDDAPPALFAVGNLGALSGPVLAMVGSRRASPLGLELASLFAATLSRAGLVIASGLALGIDAAAHRAALDAGGPSIAIAPTGVDTVYPRSHRGLARSLVVSGVLLSEFLPGVPARKGNFHRRNRTLSGISLGTVVVEAGRPSGSLITATAAAQQGREVMAMPWSLRHSGGAGCLSLLTDGATLVCEPGDVLRAIAPGLIAVGGESDFMRQAPARPESPLLDALGDESLTLERVAARMGISVPECQRLMASLEIDGLVTCRQGMWMRSGA